jgi:uncharacterized protein YycO
MAEDRSGMTIEPGDFCVRPVPGVIGLGISVGQVLNGEKWGEHDHAEVYIGRPAEDAKWGYTASSYPNRQGIRALTGPPEELEGAVWSTGKFEMSPEQREEIVKWCLEHGGVAYGWLDYAALTLHRLGMKDPGLQRFISSDKSMICSQYTAAAYLHGAGIDLIPGQWEGYITPEALAEIVGA